MASRLFSKTADRFRTMMTTGTSYDGVSASGNSRQHAGDNYNAPQQSYSAPQHNYSPSQHTYNATQHNYNATAQSPGAPQHNYNAPQHNGQLFNAPQHTGNIYNAPQHTGNVYHGDQHTGNVYNTSTNNYSADPNNPFAPILASQGKSTPLHKACAKGDEGQVRLLLESGEDMEAKDADHMTPLQVAVQKNRLNIVALLIENKANIEAHFKYWIPSQPPIFLAVYNRNEPMVRLLLDNGVEIDETSSKALGGTPLSVASKDGSENIVALLLERGAEVDPMDTFACTPLYWATSQGHQGIIVKLLQAGASTDVRPSNASFKPLQTVIQSKPQVAHLFK